MKGNELFQEFANTPIAERAKWFDKLILRIQKSQREEIIKEIERIKTTCHTKSNGRYKGLCEVQNFINLLSDK